MISLGIPAIAATGKPVAVNPAGFPAPDLRGYVKESWPMAGMIDASPLVDGKESLVEKFKNQAGDAVLKFSTNGLIWGFGVLPADDAMRGYVLRDPTCAHKLTEKWAPTEPWSAPECAVRAKPPVPSGTAAPRATPAPTSGADGTIDLTQ